MNLKDVLEVPEGHGAVLNMDERWVMFQVKRVYDFGRGRNFIRTTTFYGEGKRNLATPSDNPIESCAGVIWQNGSYVLIHGQNSYQQWNLRNLLRRTQEQDGRQERIGEIHLCTTCPEPEYERVIREILGHKVQVRRHRKAEGRAGVIPQDVAVGMDVFYTGV